MNNVFEKLAEINFEQLTREDLERIYLEQFNEAEQKRLGQIYTPDYIIRFILHQIDLLTGFQFDASNPDLKILDPACGLGGFLVGAYELLKKKLENLHWKDEEIHRALLTRILYGIDIEPLAVQITALAMLLKRRTQSINKMGLAQFDILNPGVDISKNLKWIDLQKVFPNYFNRTNEISEKSSEKEIILENFDIIIGNPPYFLFTQKEGRSVKGKQFHATFLPKNLMETYRSYYKAWPAHHKDQNVFYLFIERSIQLLREGGVLGFIVPDILLAGETTENLRRVILETSCLKKIILVKGKVFQKRGISNVIIILQRCSDIIAREKNVVEIIFTTTQELSENDSKEIYNKFELTPHYMSQASFKATPKNNFAIRITERNFPVFQNIFDKIRQKKLVKLGEIVEIQRGIENLKRKDALNVKRQHQATARKLISASNIEKYRINWDATLFPHKFVDYDPQNSKYKNINFKKQECFLQPKIVLKRVCNKLIAALDPVRDQETDYFFTMDSVQMLWLKEEFKERYDLRVILAILNSEFMNFYYETLFSYKQLFSRVQKAFLLELPIPSSISNEIQEKVFDCVDQLMKSFNQTTNNTLNQIIYALYFTQEELNRLLVNR